MPDREKVIKALKCCADKTGKCCYECPYEPECNSDQESVSFDSDPECVSFNMLKDALTLLQEQEPVEPTAEDEAIRVKYNCGVCGYLVGFVSTIHDDMQYRAKFCPECGKRVKWE